MLIEIHKVKKLYSQIIKYSLFTASSSSFIQIRIARIAKKNSNTFFVSEEREL